MRYSEHLKRIARMLTASNLIEKAYQHFREAFVEIYKSIKEDHQENFNLKGKLQEFSNYLNHFAKAHTMLSEETGRLSAFTKKDAENLYWESQYNPKIAAEIIYLISQNLGDFQEIIDGEYVNTLEQANLSTKDLLYLVEQFLHTIEEDPFISEPSIDHLINEAAKKYLTETAIPYESGTIEDEDLALAFYQLMREIITDVHQNPEKAEKIIKSTLNYALRDFNRGELRFGLENLKIIFERENVSTFIVDLALEHLHQTAH